MFRNIEFFLFFLYNANEVLLNKVINIYFYKNIYEDGFYYVVYQQLLTQKNVNMNFGMSEEIVLGVEYVWMIILKVTKVILNHYFIA